MVITRSSKETLAGAWLSRIKQYFNIRQVIIEVPPGETREDSATDHPEAKYANIRVFNRMKYDQGMPNSGTGQIS